MTQSSKRAGSNQGRWADFKAPSGTSTDVRKRVAEMRQQVQKERQVFRNYSLLNGGTKLKEG